LPRQYTDQTGYSILLDAKPKRIVSIVPSQTELLHALGLSNEVVGITKFCIHPNEWFRSKTRVGGTKRINHSIIERLNPDLILANKEENSKSDVEALREKYPVWTSDIFTLEDNYNMVLSIGHLCDIESKAKQIINRTKTAFSNLKKCKKGKALYLIWFNPVMAAGTSTYINDLLTLAGYQNILSGNSNMDRYPEISLNTLTKLKPEHVLLSSEPFPFKDKHLKYFKDIFPNAQITLVDGEMFSWYGSRPILAANYFKTI